MIHLISMIVVFIQTSREDFIGCGFGGWMGYVVVFIMILMNRERYSVRLDGNRFFFGLFGPISFWNVFDYFVPCCGLKDGGGRRDILYELQIWES